MKTQGKVWIIYDAEKKTQTKPMSIVQAQVSLLSIVEKNTAKFFLWTPGWEKWICVKDFLASEQKYFVLSQPPRPDEPPVDTVTATQNAPATHTSPDSPYTQVVVGDAPVKNDDLGGYYFKDFNGDELDLKNIPKPKHLGPPNTTEKKSSSQDRRRETRHNFKIEVVLVSKMRSFRTYSRNISLSGTMLEDEIPKDFLNKPFDLIIVNPFEPDLSKGRLLFRAKIVGDLTDPRRLMFIEQDVAMTVQLDALLKAYVAYQDLIRKNVG
ncbi:MAG: PilZ domain-containing protein [Bdellovibrio sp.]